MLVLTRREKETVIVLAPDGTEIRVTVLRTGNAVRLGLEAPQAYKILREELPQRTTDVV